MEFRVRTVTEELGQLKVRQAEQIKRAELTRKTRAIEITALKQKVANALSFESKVPFMSLRNGNRSNPSLSETLRTKLIWSVGIWLICKGKE